MLKGNTQMKKKIAVIAVFIIVLTLISGCKGKSNRPFDYDISKYIALGDYIGIEYTYSVEEVTEEAINSYINSALADKGYGEESDVTDRAVQNGDEVNISFVGRMNGEEFEGGSSDSYDLLIGSNSFIDGFEAGLVGVNKGETKVLDLKFPDDYGNEELNGKDVEFTVTVNSITTIVYPELTDEIVKEISDCQTVDEYNTYVNDQVQLTNEQNATNDKEMQIWNKIVENTTVYSYPENELTKYKEIILDSYDQSAQSQFGMSYEEFLKQAYNKTLEDIDDEIMEQVKATVKDYMTVVAIARDQDLDLTDEEYQSELESYAKSNGYSDTQEFLDAIDESQFYLSLLINRVMDFVVDNAVQIN